MNEATVLRVLSVYTTQNQDNPYEFHLKVSTGSSVETLVLLAKDKSTYLIGTPLVQDKDGNWSVKQEIIDQQQPDVDQQSNEQPSE